MLNKCPSSTLCNSSNTNQNSSSFSTTKLLVNLRQLIESFLFFFYRSFLIPNDNECCICMDRQPNLVLPCTHKFCDECFHQWLVSIFYIFL